MTKTAKQPSSISSKITSFSVGKNYPKERLDFFLESLSGGLSDFEGITDVYFVGGFDDLLENPDKVETLIELSLTIDPETGVNSNLVVFDVDKTNLLLTQQKMMDKVEDLDLFQYLESVLSMSICYSTIITCQDFLAQEIIYSYCGVLATEVPTPKKLVQDFHPEKDLTHFVGSLEDSILVKYLLNTDKKLKDKISILNKSKLSNIAFNKVYDNEVKALFHPKGYTEEQEFRQIQGILNAIHDGKIVFAPDVVDVLKPFVIESLPTDFSVDSLVTANTNRLKEFYDLDKTRVKFLKNCQASFDEHTNQLNSGIDPLFNSLFFTEMDEIENLDDVFVELPIEED